MQTVFLGTWTLFSTLTSSRLVHQTAVTITEDPQRVVTKGDNVTLSSRKLETL